MNRLAALLFTVVLVVGSVSALPIAASAATTTLPAASSALQAEANASDVSPGQRLAGVVGAGQAEFEGEHELRAYGIEYAQANSNASKAGVVADRLETVRERIQAIEERQAALEAARQNGSMSQGEYEARVTALAARSQQVQQLANASEARARSLPDDALAANGVNVTAIRTLQAQAAELTGQEVAAIAKSIAGPEVGRSIGGGPPSGVVGADARDAAPEDRGGDKANASTADARTAIAEAQSEVEAAQQRLERANSRAGANPPANASAAIDAAEADLERAQSAIDRAQAALDEGDTDEAVEQARRALEHAEAAAAHAQDAIDAASDDRGTDRGDDGA